MMGKIFSLFVFITFCGCISRISADEGDLTESEKTSILNYLNRLRRSVIPSARNMRELTWNNRYEFIAKNASAHCQMKHFYGGMFEGRGETAYYGGSNIVKAATLWFIERENYNYATGNCDLRNGRHKATQYCAHYHQVVDAYSHEIGCARTKCDGFYSFYCEYTQMFSSKLYKEGGWCTACPDTAPWCYRGLCVTDQRRRELGDDKTSCKRVCLGCVHVMSESCRCFCPLHTQNTADMRCEGLDCEAPGMRQKYRGRQSNTARGRTCQKWNSQTPHRHVFTPNNTALSRQGIGDHNYCRFVGKSFAWCYTTDPDMRVDVCFVKQCPDLHKSHVKCDVCMENGIECMNGGTVNTRKRKKCQCSCPAGYKGNFCHISDSSPNNKMVAIVIKSRERCFRGVCSYYPIPTFSWNKIWGAISVEVLLALSEVCLEEVTLDVERVAPRMIGTLAGFLNVKCGNKSMSKLSVKNALVASRPAIDAALKRCCSFMGSSYD